MLASDKHEVILSTESTDYKEIDSFIEEKIDKLMPEVINNPRGIKKSNFAKPPTKLYKRDLITNQETEIYHFPLEPTLYSRMRFLDNKIFFIRLFSCFNDPK